MAFQVIFLIFLFDDVEILRRGRIQRSIFVHDIDLATLFQCEKFSEIIPRPAFTPVQKYLILGVQFQNLSSPQKTAYLSAFAPIQTNKKGSHKAFLKALYDLPLLPHDILFEIPKIPQMRLQRRQSKRKTESRGHRTTCHCCGCSIGFTEFFAALHIHVSPGYSVVYPDCVFLHVLTSVRCEIKRRLWIFGNKTSPCYENWHKSSSILLIQQKLGKKIWSKLS